MAFDFKHCDEESLWKFVAAHLSRRGIDSVFVEWGNILNTPSAAILLSSFLRGHWRSAALLVG
jgi:hypothetical protein